MTEHVDVLLIGGGVASVRCARTLRREGFAGSIVLAGEEELAPYNRPPLSKELLRDDAPDELVAAEAESWYARRRVELRRGVTVASLDPDARRATLADGSTIGFDRCLLATGAEPMAPPVPGAEHGLLLRTLSDARRIRTSALEAGSGASAAVIGGGFIGVEVASGLAALGLRPTIVERSGALWGGGLGSALSSWAVDRLAAAGIEVRLNAAVTDLRPGEMRIGDERIPIAFAVAGVGVRPRTRLAIGAGLSVDDGVVTDARQRTSHAAVWAAGDVARWAERRVEHWHAARESGERAARDMLGLPVPPPPVPWFFSEVAGTAIDVFGATAAWDEERWLAGGSVLAWLAGGRVVQLASIGSSLTSDAARRLVAGRESVVVIEEAAAAR
jgi:apoptosis-inducing factor 3